MEFTLVTYNTLAQSQVDPHIKDRYGYVTNPEYLTWAYRKSLLIEQFPKLSADILCLQEIELNDFLNDFEKHLAIWNYDYFSHSVTKDRTNPMGNVTLWNKDKFECIASSQRSSAIFTTLKNKENNNTTKIANVHLKAGYKTFETTRNSQLKSTIKFNPDIICGDFNDELATSGLLYDLLTENNYKITPNYSTTSVYFDDGKGSIFHKFWCFDHILSKSDISIHKCEVTEKIPNKNNPSDHIPLISTIII